MEQPQYCGCKRPAHTASNLLGQWATAVTTTQVDVAPTNNAAEHAIRTLMLKLQVRLHEDALTCD